MGKEGTESLAAVSGLKVEDYAWVEQSGRGDGGEVSIPRHEEALFGVVIFLASFIADGNTELGAAALDQSDKLGRHLEKVASEISKSQQLPYTFRQLFNRNLRA